MSAKTNGFGSIRMFLIVFIIILLPGLLGAQGASLPENKGFFTVKQIMADSCSACHDWASSYEGIADPARVTPSAPEKSPLYLKIANDSMPMAGDKLTSAQKTVIRAWIAAGATQSETTAGPSAASLGLAGPDMLTLHEISGFTTTGLFYAAGIVSAVHFFSIMTEGHAYAESHNIDEDTAAGQAARTAYLIQLESSPEQQALKWWHVGLVSSAELTYMYNAITGIDMWSGDIPLFSKPGLHRLAFFTHAGLMAAELILGFITTNSLETGNHELHRTIGFAHIAIGFTIPTLILIGGLENIF
jgi:hypothetical protein